MLRHAGLSAGARPGRVDAGRTAGAVNTVGIALLSGMALRYQDLGDNAGLLWAIYSALGAAAST